MQSRSSAAVNSLIAAGGRLVRLVAPGFIGVAFIRLGLPDAQQPVVWTPGHAWALVAAACLAGFVLNRIHTSLLDDLFGWLAISVSRHLAPHAKAYADAATISTYDLMLRMEERRVARRNSTDKVQAAFQRKHDDLGDSITFFCCSAYPGLFVLGFQLVLGRAHFHFQPVVVATISLLMAGIVGGFLYARREVWAYQEVGEREPVGGADAIPVQQPPLQAIQPRPAAPADARAAKKIFRKRLQAWILDMFYPAVLGAVFYLFLPFLRNYDHILRNFPAFLISLLLVVHFCTDYLYTKLLDDYSLVVFVTDMVVIFCLYYAFDSVNYVDHEAAGPHFNTAAYAMGIIYAMFIVSDVILRWGTKLWRRLVLFETVMAVAFFGIGAAYPSGTLLAVAVAAATSGLIWFTVKTFPAKPAGD